MPETGTELLDRPAAEIAATETDMSSTEISATETGEVIAADELVEEISIDGMCGVY
ncbi:MAG TPA: mycofactocin precursor MftA [Streptosporangiaceae bacterium]|jgi:mycofactocin precursor|nr:mycofactocin precursor MftA [Streptosporangiaceae bacterium]